MWLYLAVSFKKLHFFPSAVSLDRELDSWLLHLKSPQQGGSSAALTQPGTGQMWIIWHQVPCGAKCSPNTHQALVPSMFAMTCKYSRGAEIKIDIVQWRKPGFRAKMTHKNASGKQLNLQVTAYVPTWEIVWPQVHSGHSSLWDEEPLNRLRALGVAWPGSF